MLELTIPKLVEQLLRFGAHDDECDLVTRGRMTTIAQVTMEQVVGRPHCTCGWTELRQELADTKLGNL